MKKLILFLCAVLVGLCMVQTASASSFSLTVDFDEYTFQGRDFNILVDTPLNWPDNVPYGYSFQFGSTPGGERISKASLTLTHWGNWNGFLGTESWKLTTGTGIFIGELATSGWSAGWVTDEWTLSGDVLSEIQSEDPWSLNVKVDETTRFIDVLLIDASTLSGKTSAVPIPGAVWLFGSCLVGIEALRRKFGKRGARKRN